jgi:hypothetical protein
VLKLQNPKNDFSAPSLLVRAGDEEFFEAENFSVFITSSPAIIPIHAQKRGIFPSIGAKIQV